MILDWLKKILSDIVNVCCMGLTEINTARST